MDKIKVTTYYLILNMATTQSESTDKEFNYIRKHSLKIMKSLSIASIKTELIARLRSIKDICDNMTETSHEMLAYIAIDFLVNVEGDTTARGKFLHINTIDKLKHWEQEYPEQLREHYRFFNKVVDNL